MGHLFTDIYHFFRRRVWAFVLLLALIVGFEAWFGSRIVFEEDINKVIPASEKNNKLISVLEHARFADRLVVCISQKEGVHTDPELLSAFADALIDSLQSRATSHLIDTIEGRFTPASMNGIYEIFYKNLPLFLDEADYDSIRSRLDAVSVENAIRKDYEALVSPGGFVMKKFILKDPLSFTPLALSKLENLRVSENFELHNDHIFTKDRRNLLFFIIPANPSTETSENAKLLSLIDQYGEHITRHFNNKAGMTYFGTMPVSIGNAGQIKRDIMTTVSIAIVLLLLFIGLYFRRKLVFILIFLPALLGGGFALAMMFLLRHEVSAISLGLGSVMLGISLDYALHFLSHLRQTGSVRTVIRDIASPVMVSSITTASAFLCLLILRSEAMRDLGLFAAFSVLSSAIFTLVVLPQFFREEQQVRVSGSFVNRLVFRIASYAYHKKGRLVWLIVLLFIVFTFTAGKVSFESNMDSMNYMTDKLIESEDFLDSISDYKLRSVYLVSGAENLDEALSQNEALIPEIDKLKAKGIVETYISVHPFLPSLPSSKRKVEQWNDFWDAGMINTLQFLIDLEAKKYKFREGTFDEFYNLLRFDKRNDTRDLGLIRDVFLNEYINETDSLAMVTSVLKVKAEDKPAVYEAFEGYPKLVVFDRQSLTSSFMEGLKDDFNILLILSLSIVFLIITLSLGRIELGIITFIPLLISWVFTLGIMGLLGIRFNIFNIVISTFVFGLGIDYAIFTMRGLMQEYQFGRKKLDSYKTSILLSGITTLVGIGVLIFARHPALQSIAISAIIGISSVIFITYTLLPRLFNFLIIHEGRYRRWPVTFRDFLFSVNTFIIFLVGVTILNIAGLILKYLVPMKTSRKKLIFHYMLSYACRVIVFGSVNIRKTIRNRTGKKLREPCVVVCNHQSHLDTVVNILQQPRMILLTHSWVQKSIFFGWFVRFADFQSVDEGVMPIMEKLREVAANGYSIFVFPEGTRSYDLEIGRFHQGAFLIARELDLDILPVISYGSGNAMPKFEPFLKTSPVSMTTLERIPQNSPLIKDTTLATSKSIRRHMKKEYSRIRKEFETPAFFRKKVTRNYLFRGPVLEWYIKVKIRMEKHYLIFHGILPEKGLISDIGCGYGFMAYMLQLMAPGRRIIGYDHDPDKIDTAQNNNLNNKKTEFIQTDITVLEPENSDAFLLADVLHYLPAEEQEKLITACSGKLNAGGVIIIRDADADMQRKHRGTKLTEFMSTRTGFNRTRAGGNKLYFMPKRFYLGIFEKLGLEIEIIDDTKLTSNLVYILRKKK